MMPDGPNAVAGCTLTNEWMQEQGARLGFILVIADPVWEVVRATQAPNPHTVARL